MFETTPSFYLTAGLVGAIWLIGLWLSTQHAFPKGSSGHPELSRRVLFHVASLLAAAGPVHTFLNGFSRISPKIWVVGIAILYGIWAYWYLPVYRYSDFLFEVGDFASSAAKQAAGTPRFMDVPNWVFNNPVLLFIGIATTMTGFILSAVYWQLSFLSFAAYGIIYLFFVWVYNRLDIVKVWDTHLEFRNGFSTGEPTRIPLTEIKSVERSSSAAQKRLGVSTVEIVAEQTSLRFAIKNVDAFMATLKT